MDSGAATVAVALALPLLAALPFASARRTPTSLRPAVARG
jgi:hypothetical protein